MLVSSGYAKSYWRQSKKCTLQRNGSFVDIFYDDDGRQKWLGLSEQELRAYLDSGDAEGEGLINFDEPSDVQTALREMFARRSLEDVRAVVTQDRGRGDCEWYNSRYADWRGASPALREIALQEDEEKGEAFTLFQRRLGGKWKEIAAGPRNEMVKVGRSNLEARECDTAVVFSHIGQEVAFMGKGLSAVDGMIRIMVVGKYVAENDADAKDDWRLR